MRLKATMPAKTSLSANGQFILSAMACRWASRRRKRSRWLPLKPILDGAGAWINWLKVLIRWQLQTAHNLLQAFSGRMLALENVRVLHYTSKKQIDSVRKAMIFSVEVLATSSLPRYLTARWVRLNLQCAPCVTPRWYIWHSKRTTLVIRLAIISFAQLVQLVKRGILS